jgi:hypothetical protein
VIPGFSCCFLILASWSVPEHRFASNTASSGSIPRDHRRTAKIAGCSGGSALADAISIGGDLMVDPRRLECASRRTAVQNEADASDPNRTIARGDPRERCTGSLGEIGLKGLELLGKVVDQTVDSTSRFESHATER